MTSTEKARLQAEAKAAEDARLQAEAEAAAEAKRKRELEREAARQRLLKVIILVFKFLSSGTIFSGFILLLIYFFSL